MLALQKDVRIKLSGSSGGLYDPYFYGRDDMLPFDKGDLTECNMRVLTSNLPSMLRDHYAFLGQQDEGFGPNIEILQKMAEGTKLKVIPMAGDHFSSLEPSINYFINLIKEQK